MNISTPNLFTFRDTVKGKNKEKGNSHLVDTNSVLGRMPVALRTLLWFILPREPKM